MVVKKSALYNSWDNMKQRCNNPNRPDYKRYGARGINVCDRWVKFKNFKQDMLSGFEEGLSLERIDNKGDYEPNNCRWATSKEQANNRRSNRWVTYQGITKTLSQWADCFNIKLSTLASRYYTYKWDLEKCFNYRREVI